MLAETVPVITSHCKMLTVLSRTYTSLEDPLRNGNFACGTSTSIKKLPGIAEC